MVPHVRLGHLLAAAAAAATVGCLADTPPNANAAAPPISARIQASWNAAPLLVQILETVSLESPDSFFPLLDLITSGPPLTSILDASLTPAATYSSALALLHASSLNADRAIPIAQSQSSIDSLKLALSLKEASPLIETHYQIYNDSGDVDSELSEANSSLLLCSKWFSTPEELDAELTRLQDGGGCSASPKLYDFDHILPTATAHAPTAVFYADIHSPNFRTIYRLAASLARNSGVRLVLRWKPPRAVTGKLLLSGYGAGLDLKRVDYLTIDDRDIGSSAHSSSPPRGSSDNGVPVQDKPSRQVQDGESIFDQDAGADLVQLKAAQFENLGMRASQLVLTSASPLRTLRRLSQDFPRFAYKLVTEWEPALNSSIADETRANQAQYIEGGRNVAWLNGMPMRDEELKPFALLRILRKERKIVSSITSLGLSAPQAIDILSHRAVGASSGPPPAGRGFLSLEALGELFDASDARESAEAGTILYWNDIERDSRYRNWPRSLQALLQPMYPGQLPQIRRNAINVVLVMDLSKRDNHAILADNVATFIQRGVGIRFGMVPLLQDTAEHIDLGQIVSKTMWYLVEKAGRAGALAFSRDLASHTDETLTLEKIQSAYVAIVRHAENLKKGGAEGAPDLLPSLEAVLTSQESPQLEETMLRAKAYNKRLGLAAKGGEGDIGLGSFFVNGRLFALNEEFRQNLQQTMAQHTQYLTQQLYLNELSDGDDISTFFYTLPSTFSSRNAYIFPDEDRHPLRFVDVADLEQRSGLYCRSDATEAETEISISIWLVADETSESGLALANAARQLVAADPAVRFCLISNSPLPATSEPASLFRWLGRDSVDEAGAPARTNSMSQAFGRIAGFLPGQAGLVLNGRIIGPFEEDDNASVQDLEALVAYERTKRIDAIIEALAEVVPATTLVDLFARTSRPDFLARLSSVVSLASLPPTEESFTALKPAKRSRDYGQIPGNYTSFVVGNEETAIHQFGVILDPLSETAQSWSAILETLSEMPSVSVRVYLNPNLQRTDMPLKRFFRYSLSSEPAFDHESGLEVPPSVVFHGLPRSTLLTFHMDTPHAWQAFAKESVHDLDNIRLGDLKLAERERGVDALFELENIIVEGHAREMRSGAPPRGLQLLLSDERSGTQTDTLVMANLGYHQLKANPGIWKYGIRDGRSSEVFRLESLGGESRQGGGRGDLDGEVAVTSFEGITVFPRFSRRAGQEDVDLLDEEAEESGINSKADLAKKATEVLGGLKNRMQALFGQTPNTSATHDTALVPGGKGPAKINVFTVASGLLYERMSMIMILSVLRHTTPRGSIKFWFINNFLSPSFKAFIPHLAHEYGFDYELVTYTWPAWLRSQSEKQRTIWGYKILFLDVLFPLELQRVIFVDSDQIVRTDLRQLVDMDLKGAPYAYAPMGDDRVEMENYRFWKGGYWKDHLRGKPYHISALYVIDLDRFRQMAAGDRLRGQYQALSADPNSLANLDQDLPNNMQHSIPIHTLDRSWLWCETWCSDETLADAKTIDLCNNPKTHEPKLQRAKRLLPEWTVYDKEIAALAARVAAASSSKSPNDGSAGHGDRAEGSNEAVGSAAQAFSDEAGDTQQAKMQQVEFVEEGTGRRSDVGREELARNGAEEQADALVKEQVVKKGDSPSAHARDEL